MLKITYLDDSVKSIDQNHIAIDAIGIRYQHPELEMPFMLTHDKYKKAEILIEPTKAMVDQSMYRQGIMSDSHKPEGPNKSS